MIDRQGKHKIHISCCAGFISKHKDIFVVSLSLLDTETTKWITAMPDHLHPGYWVWTMKNLFGIGMEDKQVLVFNEKSINNKDARGHSNSTSSNGIGLGVLTWNILISTHRGSLPRQAINTRDIDYSQYHGCWWPGNASKVSTTRNYLSYIYVQWTHLCSWGISHETRGSYNPSWSISCVLMVWRPKESRNVETRIFQDT